MDCKITESNTGPVDSPAFDARYTLDRLPNDVLLSIWSHLDRPEPFALVIKRFQTLSKDTLWRAKWLMQRYERYLVIFEAIARPKLFTPSLLDRLIRLGAPLSVKLIQLIQLTWNPSIRHVMLSDGVRWGEISLSAYLSLMQHAVKLYSDNISVEREDCQSNIFENWMEDQDQAVREFDHPAISYEVRCLFEVDNFMPLPVAGHDHPEDGIQVMRSYHQTLEAIVYDLTLAVSALRNGYTLTTYRTKLIIEGWYTVLGKVETNTHIHMLQVDGVVNVSKEFVMLSCAFAKDRSKHDKEIYTEAARRDEFFCSLFVRLNEASALPFRLQDLVENYADHLPASRHKHDQSAN